MNHAKRILLSVSSISSRLAYESGTRRKVISVFFSGLGLLVLGYAPESIGAQELPSVSAQVNAPGWITIIWEHSGRSASRYLLQREDPAFTWVFETNIGKYTDMGLKPGTVYKYRVCAIDHNDKESCSPWITATTLPPETSSSYAIPVITRQEPGPNRIYIAWSSTTSYGSFNVRWSEKGFPATQVNVKGNRTYGSYEARGLQPGRAYVFGVQGCNWGLLGSGCSGWRVVEITTPLPPPPPPTAPAVTVSASSPTQIALIWPVNEVERITRTVVERDGSTHFERPAALNRFDDSVRSNTEYSYRVCVTNQTGSACSNTITAMAKPVAPSALANITFTQSRVSGTPGGDKFGARINTVLRANWRNTGTPGQYITLEREDRGPIDPIRIGTSWTEVKRITAKTDPTEIWTEVKPAGPRIGVREGSTYRVCTVVPALGKAGIVCSSSSLIDFKAVAVTNSIKYSPTEPPSQTKESIDLNALAARGEEIANEDPLAVELRNQQSEGPARRGFDIGMAAAEGQTLPGPGKQRIHNSLNQAEQEGFRTAVSFSLERNRNADRAAKGAAIAQADPVIGEARNANRDVFYRLGFDIATGIFGNPSLGAQGNTAMGPGSRSIRDSLSPAGQHGFDDSVKLNLSARGGTAINKNRIGRGPGLGETAPKPDPAPLEIRCRGYGRVGGRSFVFTTISTRMSVTGETIVTSEMAFTPALAAAGADGRGLDTGECALADRPLTEREPLRVRFETVADGQIRQRQHGSTIDNSPTAAERFPDIRTIPEYLRDPKHYWSFFVINSNQGYFRATYHKYWKPTNIRPYPGPKIGEGQRALGK